MADIYIYFSTIKKYKTAFKINKDAFNERFHRNDAISPEINTETAMTVICFFAKYMCILSNEANRIV